MSVRRVGTSRGIGARLTGLSYFDTLMTFGPNAYWRHGEGSGSTLTDSSGNAKNGTYSGTIAWTTGLISGDSNQCVDYNGSNAHADTPSFSGALDPDQFTVMAVLNLDANGKQQVIHGRANESGTNQVTFKFYITSGNKLAFKVRNTGGSDFTATGATSLSTATKYHVAARFDASTVKVYLNGVEDGSTAFTGSLAKHGTSLGGLVAAGYTGSIVDRFDGKLDEVAYIGSAVTAGNIASLAALI